MGASELPYLCSPSWVTKTFLLLFSSCKKYLESPSSLSIARASRLGAQQHPSSLQYLRHARCSDSLPPRSRLHAGQLEPRRRAAGRGAGPGGRALQCPRARPRSALPRQPRAALRKRRRAWSPARREQPGGGRLPPPRARARSAAGKSR